MTKARKLALNSGTTRRSAKNGQKGQKTFTAAITPLPKAVYRSLLHNKMSTDSGDLRHLYC